MMNFLKKLRCIIFKHRYYVLEHFSKETRKIGCMRCPTTWAMNDRIGLMVEWCPDFDVFYETYEKDKDNV